MCPLEREHNAGTEMQYELAPPLLYFPQTDCHDVWYISLCRWTCDNRFLYYLHLLLRDLGLCPPQRMTNIDVNCDSTVTCVQELAALPAHCHKKQWPQYVTNHLVQRNPRWWVPRLVPTLKERAGRYCINFLELCYDANCGWLDQVLAFDDKATPNRTQNHQTWLIAYLVQWHSDICEEGFLT